MGNWEAVLAKYGIELDDLVEAGFALYVSTAKEDDIAAAKTRLREMLSRQLDDPNIWLMLAAASHLDDLISSGEPNAPHLSDDPASLVADELIGMSIAEYIAGKKGLFNYVRYDREKPGIIGDLPPFMDDAIGALVAASMTRVFE